MPNKANSNQLPKPMEGDVVIVIRGEHRGRVGTLDDFDERKAIVYFGTITRSVGYYLIGPGSLRRVTMHDLIQRNEEIGGATFLQAMRSNSPEHTSLLYERLLILDTLYDRHLRFLMPTLAKKDVFFAFCSTDRTVAKCACADLGELGHKVWFYEADASDGATFIARMNQGIADANRMVVFVSGASLASTAVDLEWTAGLTKRLKTPNFGIIPAILDDCAVPPLLTAFPFADFRTDYLDGLSSIAKILAGADS